MSKKSIIWLGILLFVLLAIICIFAHAKKIENGLLAAAQEKLATTGFSDLKIKFDGRDAIISGEVSSDAEKEKVKSLLAGINGVRKVNDLLNVVEPKKKIVAQADSTKLNQEAERAKKEAQKQQALAELKKELAKLSLHFSTDSDKLFAGESTVLTNVIKLLQAFPDFKIGIVGHADSRGTDEYNQNLSLRRARSVKAFLVSKGINSDRLIVLGKGETQPVADNSTAAGMARNRRVEFIVFEEE